MTPDEIHDAACELVTELRAYPELWISVGDGMCGPVADVDYHYIHRLVKEVLDDTTLPCSG